MGDEVKDENVEIGGDAGERMVQDALKLLHPETTEQSKVEVPKEEVKTEEVKETATTEVKPEPETAAGKEPEKPTEVTKSETAKPDNKKVPYTADEIAEILVNEKNIDTSRINPENLATYKTMQRGLTQKSQKLSDEFKRKEEDIAKREKALRDKQIEEEELELRREEELLEPDHAKDRQEKRQIMREKDDQNQRITQLEQMIESEKRQKIADQNSREWNTARVENNIPDDPELEPILQDMAYAYTWARNVGAAQQGQPGIGISEGAKIISNLIGNEKNLKKFINANPKFKEAFEKEIIENYNKKKDVGPNVIKSSSATGKEKPESDGKPTKEMIDDPDFDWQAKINRDALEMLNKIKK